MFSHVDGSFTNTQQDLWTLYLKPRVVHIQGVSLRDGPDVIQLAHQTIDDEVAILLNAVSTLRTRRNTLSPTYKLPPEILSRIFGFQEKHLQPNWKNRNKLGWIRVTHVCRFWRDTAFQHPNLWNEVSDRLGPKWTIEMLLRAKSAPISYSQCFTERFQRGKVTVADYAVAGHLSHIRNLTIIEPSKIMSPILQSMTTYPAPILESVYLDSRADQGCVLPPDIFNAHAPRLHRLELRRIQISWSSPILRSLTHLHIDNTQYQSQATEGNVVEYTEFFCALREMSALEDLSLWYCLPSEPRDPPSIQTVMLPHVQQLTLCSGFTIECASVIKHLSVRLSCHVTVDCGLFDPLHFQHIISFVKAHTLSAANQSPFLTLTLCTTKEHLVYDDQKWQLCFSAGDSSPDLADPSQGQADIPPISVLAVLQEDEMNNDLRRLSQSLPKDIIRELVVGPGCAYWTLTPGDWLFILGEYTAVENMSVKGEVCHALCGALGLPRAGSQQGTDEVPLTHEQLFLGNLKHIKFNQVDFHQIYEADEPEDNVTDFMVGTSVYDTLKTSLSRRHAASDTQLTLDIEGCSINPEQILGLQEVADVDWDFVETAPQEE